MIVKHYGEILLKLRNKTVSETVAPVQPGVFGP